MWSIDHKPKLIYLVASAQICIYTDIQAINYVGSYYYDYNTNIGDN